MRRLLIALATVTLVIGIAFAGVGELLSQRTSIQVGPPPAELHARSFTLHDRVSDSISGWLSRGTPGAGAVLLLHGIRADRRQMLERAKFLARAGYSVMLIDLPGHGESGGERITFGYREAEGVRAAMHYMTEMLPGERTAVIGVSLGAASFVLSKVSPAPDAAVLESMFPTLEEAVADRLELHAGPMASMFTPLLLWQLPIRLGFSADALRPIAELPTLHCPVLIASGAEDRHTKLPETKRLFESAGQPKELWVVGGAAHEDLHDYNPGEYEARVSAFLRKYLRHAG